jgi:putative hemolysin
MASRRSHGRSRETVRHLAEAFRGERLIVIFPSGRLARPTLGGLQERGWHPSALSLAQKYGSPVIPMHVSARSSWLYYLFYLVNQELRDMTLFRELLNKRGHGYRIRIAEPFVPTGDPRELTLQLRTFVAEAMPAGVRRFRPSGTDTPA